MNIVVEATVEENEVQRDIHKTCISMSRIVVYSIVHVLTTTGWQHFAWYQNEHVTITLWGKFLRNKSYRSFSEICKNEQDELCSKLQIVHYWLYLQWFSLVLILIAFAGLCWSNGRWFKKIQGLYHWNILVAGFGVFVVIPYIYPSMGAASDIVPWGYWLFSISTSLLVILHIVKIVLSYHTNFRYAKRPVGELDTITIEQYPAVLLETPK